MTAKQQAPAPGSGGPLARYERSVIERIDNFNDPRQEWRRLFSELLGTFFLVLAAAGGGMMSRAFPGVRFEMDAQPIEVTVFPPEGIRQAPVSPVDGRPMKRANAFEVEALLEEQ